MSGPAEAPSSAGRAAGDLYDAVVEDVGFVVHRQRAVDWAVQVASNRWDILALAVSGRAHYRCGDERADATRGTMLFFRRGWLHSARSSKRWPWSFYSVGFRLRPVDDGVDQAYDALPWLRRMGSVTLLLEQFRQLERLWTGREPGSSMACRGLVSLLMQQYAAAAEVSRRKPAHHQQIHAIVEAMHRNVGRVEPVRQLASRAGLSESRFRLLFHEATGFPVTHYQNRLRIQTAQDLLAGGGLRVSQVAEELGFRDVFYFSRLFKRITGAPPSAYLPAATPGRRIVQS